MKDQVLVFKVFPKDRAQQWFLVQKTSTLQFLAVVEELLVEVFKASPRDRAQQWFLVQETSTLLFLTVVEEVLVVVFKASPRDRAQQRFVEQNMLTLLFLMVEIFTDSPRDRAPQRYVAQITSTFPFLMVVLEREVFMVFPEDRVSQCLPLSRPSVVDRGGLQGFPRGQSSTASAVEQTFSHAPHRSLPRAPVHGRHDEWVCVVDVENDGEYYWNRRDNSTCWRLPRGVKHRWCLLPSGIYIDVALHIGGIQGSSPSLTTSRCFASWPVWTRSTRMPFVLVVMTHLALYSSSGVRSRCSASLPVWNRRTVMQSVAYARLVCWLRCASRGCLLFAARPRCLASRPVCFRRTVMRFAICTA